MYMANNQRPSFVELWKNISICIEILFVQIPVRAFTINK